MKSTHCIPLFVALALSSVGRSDPASSQMPAVATAQAELSAARAELAKDPMSWDRRLKTVLAMIDVLGASTNGNMPLPKGLQDTEENKRLWSTLGKEAYEMATKVHQERPKDIDALGAFASSYMYYASSFGILQAILQGMAGKYLDNANALV